jgi:hypothetical protein
MSELGPNSDIAWVGDFSFAPESRHQFVPH